MGPLLSIQHLTFSMVLRVSVVNGLFLAFALGMEGSSERLNTSETHL
jgi:hypothetical protein